MSVVSHNRYRPSAEQLFSNSEQVSKSSPPNCFFLTFFFPLSAALLTTFCNPFLPFLTPCFRNGKAKIGKSFELPNDQEKYFAFLSANRLLLRIGIANF